MCQRIKKGFCLFRKDIRSLLPALAGLGLYWLVTHLLFGRFCPAQILWNIPCPGCGMTRALGLVLTGRFAKAWKLQPPVYGWIVAGVGFCMQRYLTDSSRSRSGMEKRAKMWLGILLFLFIWGLLLYLWRLLYGFPVSVIDPGKTLHELLRGM